VGSNPGACEIENSLTRQGCTIAGYRGVLQPNSAFNIWTMSLWPNVYNLLTLLCSQMLTSLAVQVLTLSKETENAQSLAHIFDPGALI